MSSISTFQAYNALEKNVKRTLNNIYSGKNRTTIKHSVYKTIASIELTIKTLKELEKSKELKENLLEQIVRQTLIHGHDTIYLYNNDFIQYSEQLTESKNKSSLISALSHILNKKIQGYSYLSNFVLPSFYLHLVLYDKTIDRNSKTIFDFFKIPETFNGESLFMPKRQALALKAFVTKLQSFMRNNFPDVLIDTDVKLDNSLLNKIIDDIIKKDLDTLTSLLADPNSNKVKSFNSLALNETMLYRGLAAAEYITTYALPALKKLLADNFKTSVNAYESVIKPAINNLIYKLLFLQTKGQNLFSLRKKWLPENINDDTFVKNDNELLFFILIYVLYNIFSNVKEILDFPAVCVPTPTNWFTSGDLVKKFAANIIFKYIKKISYFNNGILTVNAEAFYRFAVQVNFLTDNLLFKDVGVIKNVISNDAVAILRRVYNNSVFNLITTNRPTYIVKSNYVNFEVPPNKSMEDVINKADKELQTSFKLKLGLGPFGFEIKWPGVITSLRRATSSANEWLKDFFESGGLVLLVVLIILSLAIFYFLKKRGKEKEKEVIGQNLEKELKNMSLSPEEVQAIAVDPGKRQKAITSLTTIKKGLTKIAKKL